MKIAIATLCTKDYYPPETLDLVLSNHKQYCGKHSYDHIYGEQSLDTSRHPGWSKVLLLQQHLKYYDYILWIDADAVFTNYEISVESIHNIAPAAPLLICQDQAPWIGTADWINTGVILIKNCEWSHRFLLDWWNSAKPTYLWSGYWDQSGFYDLLYHWDSPYYKTSNIAILPQRTMNSFPCNWQSGDFIVHNAGEKDKNRILQSLKGVLK